MKKRGTTGRGGEEIVKVVLRRGGAAQWWRIQKNETRN